MFDFVILNNYERCVTEERCDDTRFLMYFVFSSNLLRTSEGRLQTNCKPLRCVFIGAD
jgi:hypothetical protein